MLDKCLQMMYIEYGEFGKPEQTTNKKGVLKMKKFKVKNEWLVDEDNNIVKMTLREWVEYFGISPYESKDADGNVWETYKAENKTERNGFIDIYKCSGYGLRHSEFEGYMDKIFRTGNADFDVKLVEVR